MCVEIMLHVTAESENHLMGMANLKLNLQFGVSALMQKSHIPENSSSPTVMKPATHQVNYCSDHIIRFSPVPVLHFCLSSLFGGGGRGGLDTLTDTL